MVYSVIALCLHCSTNNLHKVEMTTYIIILLSSDVMLHLMFVSGLQKIN